MKRGWKSLRNRLTALTVLGLALFWPGPALAVVFTDTISGTVTNNTGNSGRVYLKVFTSTGQETQHGTSIDLNVTSNFLIRGVTMNGDYVVAAFLDETDPPVGIPYGNSAQGISPTVTMNNGAASGAANLTIDYPQTAPSAALDYIEVMPGDGALLIFVKPQRDNRGFANADHFALCYYSDENFTTDEVCPPAWENVPVTGEEVDLGLPGLVNDTPLYFRATPYLGGTPGTPATSSGTPTAPAGGHSVSGSVNFNFDIANPPPAGASVYIALVNDQIPGVQVPTALIKSYTLGAGETAIPFSVAGVPDGYFYVYVLSDLNNNGIMDIGEPDNDDNDAPVVHVAGQDLSNANVFLTDKPLTAHVTTTHQLKKDQHVYNINFNIRDGFKRPAAAALTGGPQGAIGPVDLGLSQWRNFYTYLSDLGFRPQSSDLFTFAITYTDGSTGTLEAHADVVLDAFATNPVVPAGYLLGDLRPDFSWGEPTTPPQPFYSYYFQLRTEVNNNPVLLYPPTYDQQAYLLPAGTTSMPYPLQADLNNDQAYLWAISVFDRFGNQAELLNEFMPVTQLPFNTRPALFRAGQWYLDTNNSHSYDVGDQTFKFGQPGDIPVPADWDNDGVIEPALYRAGTWYIDLNSNGSFEVTDLSFKFGQPTDIPVPADWDNDGVIEPALYRAGTWYIDNNNNHIFNAGEMSFKFGQPTDIPVPADWNNNGTIVAGLYRAGTWYIDNSNNHIFGAGDTSFKFGQPTDIPVPADWNNNGTIVAGLYRAGTWYIDNNNNHSFNVGEMTFKFGQPGDLPGSFR